MSSTEAFFRNVVSASFWRRSAPYLNVCDTVGDPVAPGDIAPASRMDGWHPVGYLRLDALLAPSAAASLARAIGTLRAQCLHPTFIYVYDEAWQALDALLDRLGPWLGTDVDVLADVWAWHIDPRTDRGGWPLHRGVYEDVRDADGVPCLINTWLSLTDATERNACMHVVPLTRVPHYPHAMKDTTGLEPLGLALPTLAGSALAWNANSAHWGGTCDPSFSEPRISMSFTLRRGDYPAGILALPRRLSFPERLDLIADQFETYGAREMAPERPEMRWAKMIAGMRTVARRER